MGQESLREAEDLSFKIEQLWRVKFNHVTQLADESAADWWSMGFWKWGSLGKNGPRTLKPLSPSTKLRLETFICPLSFTTSYYQRPNWSGIGSACPPQFLSSSKQLSTDSLTLVGYYDVAAHASADANHALADSTGSHSRGHKAQQLQGRDHEDVHEWAVLQVAWGLEKANCWRSHLPSRYQFGWWGLLA